MNTRHSQDLPRPDTHQPPQPQLAAAEATCAPAATGAGWTLEPTLDGAWAFPCQIPITG